MKLVCRYVCCRVLSVPFLPLRFTLFSPLIHLTVYSWRWWWGIASIKKWVSPSFIVFFLTRDVEMGLLPTKTKIGHQTKTRSNLISILDFRYSFYPGRLQTVSRWWVGQRFIPRRFVPPEVCPPRVRIVTGLDGGRCVSRVIQGRPKNVWLFCKYWYITLQVSWQVFESLQWRSLYWW